MSYVSPNHLQQSAKAPAESWRTAPGQLAWKRFAWQNREELALNLRRAKPITRT